MPKSQKKEPVVRRTWRVIPPPAYAERPEIVGLQVLEEVKEPVLGYVLWSILRALDLWISLPEDDRGAFPDTGINEELPEIRQDGVRKAIESLVKVLGVEGELRCDEVATAMHAVADELWNVGYPRSARIFIETVHLLVPREPSSALKLGRVARDLGELDQSEAWYEYAIFLARQTRAWGTYVHAWVGIAKVERRRGDLVMAEAAGLRALRAARRRGLRLFEAWAAHDLFMTLVEVGRWDEAVEVAREAAVCYPPGHQGLVTLVNDAGAALLERGAFAASLRVFLAVAPAVSEQTERWSLWGNIARAAGCIGDEARFDEAWFRWHNLASEQSVELEAALNFARGALALGRHPEAYRAASWVLDRAKQTDNTKVIKAAQAVTEGIWNPGGSGDARSSLSESEMTRDSEFVDELVRALVESELPV